MATDSAWTEALVKLFDEILIGVPDGQNWTMVIDGKECIFNLFDTLDAAQASFRKDGIGFSVGAHLNHARYYLQQMNRAAANQGEESDWEGSWAKQEFTPEEWRQLRLDFRAEYDSARNLFTRGEIPDMYTFHAFSQPVHAAYHLGAANALARFAL